MLNQDSDQHLNTSFLSFQSKSPLLSPAHRSSIIPNFNPYQCPPDLNLAISHGQSKLVYKVPDHPPHLDDYNQICPCCGFVKKGELIPLCGNLFHIYHLGSGYVLYFKLIQYSMVLIGLIFVSSGLFNIISNFLGNDCDPVSQINDENPYCIQDYILVFTIANKRNNSSLLEMQIILNLISAFLIFIFFQYMHYRFRKIHVEVDEEIISPADYTIKVSGIDTNLTDEDIKEWIESLQTPEQFINCKKINRTYDIRQYIKLKKKRDLLEGRKNQTNNISNQKHIQAKINKVDEQIRNLKEKGLNLTHTVLITFENADQAPYILELFNKIPFGNWKWYLKSFIKASYKKLNGYFVHIERAPEPTDILWENLGYKPIQKLKKRMRTRIVALILITISFVLNVAIIYAQGIVIKNFGQNSNLIRTLSIIGSFIIITINVLLGQAIIRLVEREKHVTYTTHFMGIAKKLSITQFINTAFTTLFAQVVLYSTLQNDNPFESDFEKINFYGKGGLLENMFYIFISNAFLTPLLTYFDPLYLLKLYQRKQVLKKGGTNMITQQEAHVLFEEPEMDISLKNAMLVKTMLMTAFFAPAVPFALIFAFLGLGANYWVDKYLLLRRTVFPTAIHEVLNKYVVEYLEWFGVMFGAGNFFFLFVLQNSNDQHIYDLLPKSLIFATLGIGVILILFPMRLLNSKLFSIKEEEIEPYDYDEMRAHFTTDYDIQNPVTSGEALHNYLKLLKENKLILPKDQNIQKTGAFALLVAERFREAVQKSYKGKTPKNKKVNEYEFLDRYTENIERSPRIARRKMPTQVHFDLNKILSNPIFKDMDEGDDDMQHQLPSLFQLKTLRTEDY